LFSQQRPGSSFLVLYSKPLQCVYFVFTRNPPTCQAVDKKKKRKRLDRRGTERSENGAKRQDNVTRRGCIPKECQRLARGCARNERHPWQANTRHDPAGVADSRSPGPSPPNQIESASRSFRFHVPFSYSENGLLAKKL
jgi:hypothetical protein